MKLVVDLPDNMVKMCGWHKEGICELTDLEVNMLAEAIDNGKPLPKGHGDLKDINDLCYKSRYGCKGNCDYLYTCNLYGAPTIIESDKTESEGKDGRES